MLRGLLAFAAVAIAAACVDLSTDLDAVAAIEFGELAWPSIVAGDTLRDSTGAAARLRARLYDGNGDEVTAEVEFISQDKDVRVVDGSLVVADDKASGTARLLASTSGIQSIVRQLEVVAAPESLAAEGTVSPLSWVVPDDPALNTSVALGVRVLDGAGQGVRSWVVTFELNIRGQVVARSDTSHVFLVNEAGRPSYADTTDTQGIASRKVRLRIAAGLVAPDSAVVTVRASHRGTALRGSAIRLVLPIRPG